jgi:hypothetical protein
MFPAIVLRPENGQEISLGHLNRLYLTKKLAETQTHKHTHTPSVRKTSQKLCGMFWYVANQFAIKHTLL